MRKVGKEEKPLSQSAAADMVRSRKLGNGERARDLPIEQESKLA